ncbi:hypothetical protein HXX76_009293 [Chlamydomonas incerta]|uniref:Uncharacterized protein n=1 Tax=Chlamydomonas incerta TaxID=51695 RepID=A0A835SRF8_CHLIN|nr:hypothetical protein HXX76_009293 [Chlamydomonas incerta]|eukprot:KAG2431798.1 hypothetical protein HXX76_009293 [Chlamydomonas incerta]
MTAGSRRGDALVPSALRGPKHAYGGPEPFGTGTGLLRWQREATALLANELRVEREKEWKRLRHKLVSLPPSRQLPRTQNQQQQQQLLQNQKQHQGQDQGQGQQVQGERQEQQQQQLQPGRAQAAAAVGLDEETLQDIERTRMKIRFRKFWDLMHERDRPWHYDAVLHLCTALPPYTCERYAAVTAGTMQGILARRAKAERAVREQRELASSLRRRMAAASLQMSRTGQPISDEWLAQLRRLAAQLATGGGNAAAALRQLQGAAWSPYRDQDYVDHVAQLLPLLEETEEVGHVALRHLLPALQRLRAETSQLQVAMSDRALARDQVLAALQSLHERRREPGSAADPDSWPPLTEDEAVTWRYPPMPYWGRPEELRQQAGWRQGQGQAGWQQDEPGGGSDRGSGSGGGTGGSWGGYGEGEGYGGEGFVQEERWPGFEAVQEPGGWGIDGGGGGGTPEVAWAQAGAAGSPGRIIPGLFD